MCADQLTRERHKRKVFLHFSKRPCLTSVPCSHKCDSLDHCTIHRPEQAWLSQFLSLPSLLLLSNLSSIFFTDEEKILFPPTYRYERGSRECYQWEKYKTSGVRLMLIMGRDSGRSLGRGLVCGWCLGANGCHTHLG